MTTPPGIGAKRVWSLLASSVILVIWGGCAASTTSTPVGGRSGLVEWRIENAKVQVEPGRTKWEYLLKLRDTSGSGIHLTQLTRKSSGFDVAGSTTEWPIDLRIEPGGEIQIPCWDSITTRAAGASGSYTQLNQSRAYSGTDGTGKPVQVQVEYELHVLMPRREPRVLELARVIVESTATRRLACEAIPKETSIFDPSRHDFVYLLIVIENVRRRVPARTRWIDPFGQEVKVIRSEIDAMSVDRITSVVHVTHSLATTVMRGQPGRWKVELYLDETLQGTHTLEALPPGGSLPRRL